MKHKLIWLFQFLLLIGAVSYTLSFFDIGREFFDRNLSWFLAALWIGIIGNFLLKRIEKY